MAFETEKMQELFERLVAELNFLAVPATWYTLEAHNGYQALTGNASDTIYCLEAELGVSKNGKTYAFAQVFWDKHPNLVLIGMLVRAENRAVLPVNALYNRKIDAIFSKIFLPLMYRAFNHLDPSGKLGGQVVQRYSATTVLFEDLLPAIGYTLQLVTSRALFGQYATITIDFDDRLTSFIAWLMQPIKKANHLYIIPQTKNISAIRIPIRNRQNSAPYELKSSTALNEAFSIAIHYLEGAKFDRNKSELDK